MKLNELKLIKKTAYLYEGLTPKHRTSMMLWESAGRAIAEAQLSPQQISNLFQQVEQGASAAGGNRTLVGQGKDVADSVSKAYNDLKGKVANSATVQGFDSLYDQAAEKLKQATGGDAGAMQYVQKYRDFAKAHPIAQSLIYSALIAAAGISGVGAVGAAALGLLKMTDKLLQGEKFSSAVYQGAKTGGMAYAAGQIGQAARNVDLSNMDLNTTGAMESRVFTKSEVASLFESIVIEAALWDKFKQGAGAAVTQVVGATPGQIAGAAKGAAGAVGQKLAQVGKNITTKVTADKLQSAWKAAGSPTDSDAIADILKNQGIADDVITSIYTSSNIARANPKFAFIAKLTLEQKQALLKQLDALAAKPHTGGKVASRKVKGRRI